MPMKNKIKQFVDSRSLTVYQFIKETGIAPGTGYKLYKNPRHMPSPTVLEIICDTYEVQPGEILEWSKDERGKENNSERRNLADTETLSETETAAPIKHKRQPKGSLPNVA
jgi:DNA-binding Xre family transcriptional regulator